MTDSTGSAFTHMPLYWLLYDGKQTSVFDSAGTPVQPKPEKPDESRENSGDE